MKVENNIVVSVHYTLRNDEGEVIDSSEGVDPLRYLHGASNIIDGLEQALEGREVGNKLDVVVKPEDAYGEYNEGMRQSVPRSSFEGIDEIEVGSRFEAQTDQGPVSVVVIEVDDENVVVDGNHPLAGEQLHFSVEVVELRAASDEEIAHGHVH